MKIFSVKKGKLAKLADGWYAAAEAVFENRLTRPRLPGWIAEIYAFRAADQHHFNRVSQKRGYEFGSIALNQLRNDEGILICGVPPKSPSPEILKPCFRPPLMWRPIDNLERKHDLSSHLRTESETEREAASRLLQSCSKIILSAFRYLGVPYV